MMERFKKRGAVIFGVSGDSVESHKKFEKKENLEITLLSDPKHEISKAYDVYGDKLFLEKIFKGITRTRFIIKNGKIKKVYAKVSPKGHAEQILEEIK